MPGVVYTQHFCEKVCFGGFSASMLGIFVQTVLFGNNGVLGAPQWALTEIYIVVGLVCLLGVIRHQSNIKRLLSGTENKVFVQEEQRKS